MSDTPETQTEKKEAPAAAVPKFEGITATAEKPAAPAEPPFNTDELQSSTARFTHKAWYLYDNNRKNLEFIRTAPVRATLEARTTIGAEEIHQALVSAGVKEISRTDKTVAFNGTFEIIQKVIRHPQTFMVDAIKL
jgi:hypothetical protein